MNKSKTIFSKTFIPVLIIILLVIGSFILFIYKYVLNNLRENVMIVYEEQMINRRNDIENLVLSGADVLDNSAEQIVLEIENLIEEKGYELHSIKSDVGLNYEILINMTDYIIDTLRFSGTTDIFLILDGCGSYENKDIKAGIYIRNSEPGTYISSNSNLLFERGIPVISKKLKIPLDSYWQLGFLFEKEHNYDYFYEPLLKAQNNDSMNFRNFGYWSYENIIDENDLGVFSYSVPLISSDGIVFGVLGIGINENFLMKYYNYYDLDQNESRAYILAKTTDGKNYKPYYIRGKYYSKASLLSREIELPGDIDDGVIDVFIDVPVKAEICVNVQKFRLYGYNTPFENEQWVLLGIQHKKELLHSYYTVKKVLNLMLVVSTIVCTMCVFWFSRFISVPIQQMVSNLRKSQPNKSVLLNRTHIDEIDELAESIENLSIRVAEFYSKISKIVQMSGSGIAVFEYKEKENLVFCSHNFFEIVGCEKPSEPDIYTDISSLDINAQEIIKGRLAEDNVFELSTTDGRKHWLKINRQLDGDVVLGVVTDITDSVLEKKRIEKERDYDVLTGLLNRNAFSEKLRKVEGNLSLFNIGAMIMWDLDNLKQINDTHGHSAGDDYLIAFANCLKKFNNNNTMSARRSGDEFITFIYGYSKEEAKSIIDTIYNSVHDVCIVIENNCEYKVCASMGIAWYPEDSVDFDTLLHYADLAMYEEKNEKKEKN